MGSRDTPKPVVGRTVVVRGPANGRARCVGSRKSNQSACFVPLGRDRASSWRMHFGGLARRVVANQRAWRGNAWCVWEVIPREPTRRVAFKVALVAVSVHDTNHGAE